MLGHIYLAIIPPLAGTILLGFFGKMMPRKAAGILACGAILLSFAVALAAFIEYVRAGGVSPEPYGAHVGVLAPWLAIPGFELNLSFQADALSLLMALTVTFVSFLIFVYSSGYMAHDEGYPRYFAYLNLFVAMMLTLVLAGNLVVMFIGWEGVGLCSYLLIGFWYRKKAPPIAGIKAFIVNRIGDFGFLIGILILFWLLGSVDFTTMRMRLSMLEHGAPLILTMAGLFLFMGAMGKSAQFPLHVWLPDAMEGPTPVSALIHAATMVTAGVFLVARMGFLFSLSQPALLAIACIGAFTALFAASIAIVQYDIKRVLAYSTVSQLGLMFLAAGLGAYWIAVFHLFTHAFFKALLFLGSGSVIHAMGGEQDMRKMGGLAKRMPQTYWQFLIGAMAISGIPLLAGFYSKDEILFAAFSARNALFPQAGMALFVVGAFTALLTAFYMFRQVQLVFLTPARWDAAKVHPHEAPPSMAIPCWVLAAGSIFAGYIGLPAMFASLLHIPNALEPFLAPALPGGHPSVPHALHAASLAREAMVASLSALLALAGLGLAFYLYRARSGLTEKLRQSFAAPYRLLFNKYYIDELNNAAIVSPGKALCSRLSQSVDLGIIDGAVNFIALAIGALGYALRPLQTGFIRNYAWYFSVGAVLLIILLWLRAGG